LSFDRENIDQIKKYIPNLQTNNIKGAILFTDDSSGDCRKLTEKLSDICKKDGVEFLFNKEVTTIEIDEKFNVVKSIKTKDGEEYKADIFLFTTGYDTTSLDVVSKIPLLPVLGYSVNIPITTKGHQNLPIVSFSDPQSKLYFSRIDDNIRFSGFAEISGLDTTPRDKRKKQMISMIHRYVDPSNIDISKANFYTCLRPVSPDDVPLIGNLKYINLYVNLGHGSHGWTTSFGSAKLISQIINKENTTINIQPYDPQRFE